MSEKKQLEKLKPFSELTTSVAEILVAHKRSSQPFIRIFQHNDENISHEGFGTFLGVFEIDEESEDSAYIVNFLASVAKKEYFSNIRRGPIESFEAALHKMNLALAELVKHGNVSWLGKLHGAIGVLEKNNFHFSVTGQAKILLFRNDAFSEISAGLASEESTAHPIKTFVEVSSGRLIDQDRIMLSSPEVSALFTLEELGKEAKRMESERFIQFLKTALTNELDMAGVLVLTVSETERFVPIVKETKKPPIPTVTRTDNVFSQAAFQVPQHQKESPKGEISQIPKEPTPDEYVDTKTGHIYVQGESPAAPSTHPFFTTFTDSLRAFTGSVRPVLNIFQRTFRKTKKRSWLVMENIAHATSRLSRRSARAIRRAWRRHKERLATHAETATRSTEPTNSIPPREPILPDPSLQNTTPPSQVSFSSQTPVPTRVTDIPSTPPAQEVLDNELPSFIKEKLAQFYQKHEHPSQETTAPTPTIAEESSGSFLESFSLFSWLKKALSWNTIRTFLPHYRPRLLIFFGILFGCIIALSILALVLKHPKPAPPLSDTEPHFTADSTSKHSSSDFRNVLVLLEDSPDPLISSVVLDNQVYAITEKSVVSVQDHKTYPLSALGEHAIRFAAAMDDLRLIFVITDNNKIYAFSPLNKTFAENTFSLPEGAHISSIDTYLTYLYVLDTAHNQIYRFPRSSGGFGAGTPWLKDSVTLGETPHLAVSETLYLASDPSTVRGYFRGRATTSLSIPDSGLSVTDLYTRPGLNNIYALDQEHGRVLIWDNSGSLLHTFSDDRLHDTDMLSVNETTNEVFVGDSHVLTSFQLP